MWQNRTSLTSTPWPLDLALIRQIEEAALSAWPALSQVLDDGWILRFSNGYSKRANSINPTYTALGDVDAKIEHAEAWYGRLGLPPLFRLTPLTDPSDLGQRLEARGYREIQSGQALYQPKLADVASPPLLPTGVTARLDTTQHEAVGFERLPGYFAGRR